MLRLSGESNPGPPALQAITLWNEPLERPYLYAIRGLTCVATVRQFLRNLQTSGAFIAVFTSEKWLMTIKKSLFRHWSLIMIFFAYFSILVWCKTKGAVGAVCVLLLIWPLTLSLTGSWPTSISRLEACSGPLKRATLAEKRLFWWRHCQWGESNFNQLSPFPSQ
jgi:hypothetical protein